MGKKAKKKGAARRPLPPAAEPAPAQLADRWLTRAQVPHQAPAQERWDRELAADGELRAAIDAVPDDELPDDVSWQPEESLHEHEAASAAAGEQFYAALWSTPERALLGYRRPPEVRFLRAWLPWWAEHAPPAIRLADIGAGAGLLACGYAALRPELEVVAVEPHPAAAAVTAALAERFAVAARVRPVRGGLAEVSESTLGGPVDQVVITRVLGNVAGLSSRDLPGDALDLTTSVRAGWAAPAVAAVAELLRPAVATLVDGGVLLLVERVLDAARVATLAAGIQAAGAGLELHHSGGLPGALPRGVDRVRVLRLAARRGAPGVDPEQLRAWLWSAPEREQLHDVAGEHRRAELTAPVLWWATVRYPERVGGGLHRVEVLDDGRGGWVWETTSKRVRNLSRVSHDELPAVLAQRREYATWAATEGGCMVSTSDDTHPGASPG